jgi:hypothetical protein
VLRAGQTHACPGCVPTHVSRPLPVCRALCRLDSRSGRRLFHLARVRWRPARAVHLTMPWEGQRCSLHCQEGSPADSADFCAYFDASSEPLCYTGSAVKAPRQESARWCATATMPGDRAAVRRPCLKPPGLRASRCIAIEQARSNRRPMGGTASTRSLCKHHHREHLVMSRKIFSVIHISLSCISCLCSIIIHSVMVYYTALSTYRLACTTALWCAIVIA